MTDSRPTRAVKSPELCAPDQALAVYRSTRALESSALAEATCCTRVREAALQALVDEAEAAEDMTRFGRTWSQGSPFRALRRRLWTTNTTPSQTLCLRGL